MEEKVKKTKEEVTKDRVERLQPFMWKPGQSGNPAGRPKTKTLKEYMRETLERMTPEERDKFLLGMNKIDIWKMAEGNPAQDLTSGGEKISVVPIYGGKSINNETNGESSEPTGDVGDTSNPTVGTGV